MLISSWTNGVRCKIFVDTLVVYIVKLVNQLPDGEISCFKDFIRLFTTQFSTNKPKMVKLSDIFDV